MFSELHLPSNVRLGHCVRWNTNPGSICGKSKPPEFFSPEMTWLISLVAYPDEYCKNFDISKKCLIMFYFIVRKINDKSRLT